LKPLPRVLITAVLVLGFCLDVVAATSPLKPHAQLVEEVYDFLVSDVGHTGILTMDDDPQGDAVPPYFYHYSIRHNDRLSSSTAGYPGYASISYPGYTASLGARTFLAYWAYSGDPEALARAREYIDWLIERRTPPGDLYGNWVYSTQTDAVMGGGYDLDSVMSDKPGMFGVACLRLYEITGEASYLAAATEIADTYVATQLSGSVEDDGRWPFRVRPADGFVVQDYTSHFTPAIELLERMEPLSPGQGYGTAAQRAWDWLLLNPLDDQSPSYMQWEGFYEDVYPVDQIGDRDHYSAESALVALLDRAAPGDLDLAMDIWDWSTNRYIAPDGAQNGSGVYDPALLEWDHWPNSTYAATGQWAYTTLRLHEATMGTPDNDPTWKPRALEALHTLTYGQGQEEEPSDGRMLTTVRELTQPSFGIDTWYEQNFNTVLYILLSFGIATELAPTDEDHLLRFFGGELQDIVYGTTRIESEWSAPGNARFKLREQPFSVRIGTTWHPLPSAQTPGWSWDAAAQLCEIRHEGGDVEIALGGATAAPSARSSAWLRLAPNPANPNVVARYRLETGGAARVRIVDARGRLVWRADLGLRAAGEGEIVWRGEDSAGRPVASGNYRFVLEVDGRVQAVEQMALVR